MKKTIITISTLILAAACTSTPAGYVIKGTITGIDSGKVILSSDSQLTPVSDTVELKNGKFTFTGTVTTPDNYYLYVDGVKGGAVNLFLVNDKITIEADIAALQDAKISGPQIVKDAQILVQQRDSILTAAWPYTPDQFSALEDPEATDEQKAAAQALYDQAEEQVLAAIKEVGNIYLAYVKKDPYSPLSVRLIVGILNEYPAAELIAIADSLKNRPELQGNHLVARIVDYAANIHGVDVGKITPDFTQDTPDGAPLTFSDIYRKNKLTMIDFWASWCGPCRRFNPALVKLYNQYHAKGFEIVAVSCDKEKDEWLKAIADDNLTWHHVSDLKYWNNAVAKQFNILAIPQNVFVNADGVIVAKKIDGEKELENFLKEQLQ